METKRNYLWMGFVIALNFGVLSSCDYEGRAAPVDQELPADTLDPSINPPVEGDMPWKEVFTRPLSFSEIDMGTEEVLVYTTGFLAPTFPGLIYRRPFVYAGPFGGNHSSYHLLLEQVEITFNGSDTSQTIQDVQDMDPANYLVFELGFDKEGAGCQWNWWSSPSEMSDGVIKETGNCYQVSLLQMGEFQHPELQKVIVEKGFGKIGGVNGWYRPHVRYIGNSGWDWTEATDHYELLYLAGYKVGREEGDALVEQTYYPFADGRRRFSWTWGRPNQIRPPLQDMIGWLESGRGELVGRGDGNLYFEVKWSYYDSHLEEIKTVTEHYKLNFSHYPLLPVEKRR